MYTGALRRVVLVPDAVRVYLSSREAQAKLGSLDLGLVDSRFFTTQGGRAASLDAVAAGERKSTTSVPLLESGLLRSPGTEVSSS